MIIYSVTVAIEDSVREEWIQWMKDVHIPDVMKTGMFLDFRFCKVFPHQEGDPISFNIAYRCKNQADFDEYQKNHAPALQKDHSERYAGKFAAFRTILEQIA